MVLQRQELIRLPDISKMLAEVKIHESRVRELRPGMTAHIRIENIPDRRFKGTVRRIAPLPCSACATKSAARTITGSQSAQLGMVDLQLILTQ